MELLVLSLLWWAMTSLGWSLTHAWWKGIKDTSSQEDVDKIYNKWKEKICKKTFPDLIWWCSHLVIASFLSGYILIGAYIVSDGKSKCCYVAAGFLIAIILVIIGFYISRCIMKKSETLFQDN
jgi:hypothetical protein